jgi:glucans biosynthesis protein C
MNDGAMHKQRLYFLDNLRFLIILLVVVFHVAMGYTTWNLPWWYVNDSQQNPVFDLFILSTDVYMMPILFFIAGYFAVPSLLRYGTAAFVREKLRRIVFPWLAGAILIAPLIAFAAIFSRTATPPSYFTFWFQQFFGPYYQQAHYWFLGILTLFFLLFLLAHRARPGYFSSSEVHNDIPSATFFSLFALFTAFPFFVANLFFTSDAWVNAYYLFMIQPVRIGLYLCYFGLGIHAWKHGWFTSDGYQPGLVPWGISALVMLPLFLIYRVLFTLGPGTTMLAKAGHSLAYAAFCLTAVFALFALARRFTSGDGRLWRRLAANSYIVYFIHQCVIIPLAYWVQPSIMNVWVKFSGVSVVAVVLCCLLAEYLIRPVLSFVKASR